MSVSEYSEFVCVRVLLWLFSLRLVCTMIIWKSNSSWFLSNYLCCGHFIWMEICVCMCVCFSVLVRDRNMIFLYVALGMNINNSISPTQLYH